MKLTITISIILLNILTSFSQETNDFYESNKIFVNVKFINKDSLPLNDELIKIQGQLYQTDTNGMIEYKSYIATSFPCKGSINYNDSLKLKKYSNIIDYFNADQTYIHNENIYTIDINELEALTTGQRKFNRMIMIK